MVFWLFTLCNIKFLWCFGEHSASIFAVTRHGSCQFLRIQSPWRNDPCVHPKVITQQFYDTYKNCSTFIMHCLLHLTYNASQFVFLTRVITVLVHRNTRPRQVQWRHWAPPAWPVAKTHSQEQGQERGLIGTFRATHLPFLMPNNSFSGNISHF